MSKIGFFLMSGVLALSVSSQAVMAQPLLRNITQSELSKLTEISKSYEHPLMNWFNRYNKKGETGEKKIAINNNSTALYVLVAKVGEQRIRLLNTPQAEEFRGRLTGLLDWNTPPRQMIAKSAAAALTAAGIAELRGSKVERVVGGVLRPKDVAGMHIPGRWAKDIEDIHEDAKWDRKRTLATAQKYFLSEASLHRLTQDYWSVLSSPGVLKLKGLSDGADLKRLIYLWFAMSLGGAATELDFATKEIASTLARMGVPENHRISVGMLLRRSPIATKDNLEKYINISSTLRHAGGRFNLDGDHQARSRAARIWYFADRANVPLE